MSFAGNGEDSRDCHVFIALAPDGARLGGAAHEAPIGRVTVGLDTLDALVANRAQAGYGDLTKLQGALVREGNAAAAAAAHPRVDRIYACEVLDGPAYDTFVAFEPDPDAPRVEDL